MSAVEASVFRHPSSTVDQVVLNADGSFGGELNDVLGSKLDLAGGKILQVVRATDSTARSTNSTSFVDVTGMSVTITPQKNNSVIIVVATGRANARSVGDTILGDFQITDASNNAISGAESTAVGTINVTGTGTRNSYAPLTLFGYATPATTSATTYKLRFRMSSGSFDLRFENSTNTAQMYAIEVSA